MYVLYRHNIRGGEKRKSLRCTPSKSKYFPFFNCFNYVMYTVSFCLDTFDFESEIHDLGK